MGPGPAPPPTFCSALNAFFNKHFDAICIVGGMSVVCLVILAFQRKVQRRRYNRPAKNHPRAPNSLPRNLTTQTRKATSVRRNHIKKKQ